MHQISPVGLMCATALSIFAAGCGTPVQTNLAIGGAVAGTTLLLGQAPAHEIEQIYYLGCFDPQEQIPPTIYRIRVHGQASALSLMKFGSGWVPAQLIDSLNTSLQFAKIEGNTEDETESFASVKSGEKDQMADLQTGRRLILFGPEGFREAPRNYRLVIVMGASPDAYFEAIDKAIGDVSQALRTASNASLDVDAARITGQTEAEAARLKELTTFAATLKGT
jgi:hypothetical protein